MSVTLPQNVWESCFGIEAFDDNLEELYDAIGKQAGTYTCVDGKWSLNSP